jgi:hypothetical protein
VLDVDEAVDVDEGLGQKWNVADDQGGVMGDDVENALALSEDEPKLRGFIWGGT